MNINFKAFTNMDVTRSTDHAPTCTDKVLSHLVNPAGSAYTNSKRNFREAVDIAGEKFA